MKSPETGAKIIYDIPLKTDGGINQYVMCVVVERLKDCGQRQRE